MRKAQKCLYIKPCQQVTIPKSYRYDTNLGKTLYFPTMSQGPKEGALTRSGLLGRKLSLDP